MAKAKAKEKGGASDWFWAGATGLIWMARDWGTAITPADHAISFAKGAAGGLALEAAWRMLKLK